MIRVCERQEQNTSVCHDPLYLHHLDHRDVVEMMRCRLAPFDWHLTWTFVLDLLPYLEYLKAGQRERSGSWCEAKSEERLHKLYKLKRQEAFQANGRFAKAPPPELSLATPTLATVATHGEASQALSRS